MKLTKLGPSTTEIEIGDVTVLFSYKTPVACHVAGEGYFRTEERHSVTTSKHINRWLDGNAAKEMPQSYFDDLVKS